MNVDVNPRCASCIKVKMATESGKTTQALSCLLKDLSGKQRRRGEKLSLFLRGERRVTARCSSRRICRDKEEHSSSELPLERFDWKATAAR